MAYSNEAVTVNPCQCQSGNCNECYFFRFLPDPSVLYPEDVKAVCTYNATVIATDLPNEEIQVEIPEACPRGGIPCDIPHIML